MQQNTNKQPLVIHPFLLATYSVLAILAANIEEAKLRAGIRPLLLSLLATTILYLLLRLVLKNKLKSGLITSLMILLFFSYGHVYNFIEEQSIFGVVIGRHRWLVVLWIALFMLGIWLIIYKIRNTQTATEYLNLITAIVLIFPFAQIGLYSYRTQFQAPTGYAANTEFTKLTPPENQSLPDIYYIILDGYSRDDILEKHYQLDNNEFLNSLEDMGFYVARCSQSNYAQTQLSLASSLNFNYLENIDPRYTVGNTSRIGLSELIQNSALQQALKSLGYTIVSFDSGYEPTRLREADLYLSPNVVADINDFENLLVRTTLARLFAEGIAFLNFPPDWEARDQAHRERILFTFNELEGLPSMPGPKFVFAHIISPHWPHVFGPNGEPVHEQPDSVSGYRNQVLFINSQIEQIIDTLISQSDQPPIIIIQGDHGSIIESPQRRMSILNTYYLPQDGNLALYDVISPVNTFRLVLDYYFAGDIPLIEDTSYYSQYDDPYNYQVIPNRRPECEM